jgi:hypothetical protein
MCEGGPYYHFGWEVIIRPAAIYAGVNGAGGSDNYPTR